MTAGRPRRHLAEHHVNEVRRFLAEPDIARAMSQPPELVDDKQVPDFGGSSVEPNEFGGPKRVFIDRDVAKVKPTLKRTGLTYDQWIQGIILHEWFENVLVRLRGMTYDPAHEFAECREHMFVRDELQRDPADYEADLKKLIHETEAEDIEDPPLDLACFPYFSDPDKRDVTTLKRLAQLGVTDAQHPHHPHQPTGDQR